MTAILEKEPLENIDYLFENAAWYHKSLWKIAMLLVKRFLR